MKTVDTGGAGDTFAGALLASLAQDWSLEKSVCYAQCASAICVTRTSDYAATEKEPIDALFKKPIRSTPSEPPHRGGCKQTIGVRHIA